MSKNHFDGEDLNSNPKKINQVGWASFWWIFFGCNTNANQFLKNLSQRDIPCVGLILGRMMLGNKINTSKKSIF